MTNTITAGGYAHDTCPEFKDRDQESIDRVLAQFPDMADTFTERLHCRNCLNNNIFDCPGYDTPGLLKRGNRYYDDSGDGGLYFWVFDKTASDEYIRAYLEEIGVNICGVHIYSAYDCTGKYFSDSISTRRKGSRVLVTQRWGIDC